MQDLLVLWDAIFADGIAFDLVDYIFVAMLLYIRDLCKFLCLQNSIQYIRDLYKFYIADKTVRSNEISDFHKFLLSLIWNPLTFYQVLFHNEFTPSDTSGIQWTAWG